MKIKTFIAFCLSTLLAVSMAGCGKKEKPAPTVETPPPPAPAVQDVVNVPLSVKGITLGSQLGEGKVVAAPLSSFSAKDTIYAVVETIGSGKATLKAAWTFHRGEKTAPVNETTQEITAMGPANSEFHVSKPDGWPSGDYKVEVFLNGASVGSQSFSVK